MSSPYLRFFFVIPSILFNDLVYDQIGLDIQHRISALALTSLTATVRGIVEVEAGCEED